MYETWTIPLQSIKTPNIQTSQEYNFVYCPNGRWVLRSFVRRNLLPNGLLIIVDSMVTPSEWFFILTRIIFVIKFLRHPFDYIFRLNNREFFLSKLVGKYIYYNWTKEATGDLLCEYKYYNNYFYHKIWNWKTNLMLWWINCLFWVEVGHEITKDGVIPLELLSLNGWLTTLGCGCLDGGW